MTLGVLPMPLGVTAEVLKNQTMDVLIFIKHPLFS
jgi:hypothetical protein